MYKILSIMLQRVFVFINFGINKWIFYRMNIFNKKNVPKIISSSLLRGTFTQLFQMSV